jgi:rhamnosyltransferase
VNSVIAIIISYEPDFGVMAKLLSALGPQVSQILVVDNGSAVNVADSLECCRNPQINCLLLGDNRGVAVAQNMGIAWARQQRADYVVLFDQDSKPAHNMISNLLKARNTLHANNIRISAIGPTYIDSSTNNIANFIQLGRCKFSKTSVPDASGYIPADFLISSGALIPIEVFDEVGLMDNSLFIDLVDTEWFLRAYSMGFQSFGIPDAIMHHSLGENTRKIWFGRWRHVPQHKPFRQYYMFRNSILLYKRDYIPLQWKINDAVKLVYLFVFSMACMPERWKRLMMMMQGICDGLRGRTGKLECADE